MKLTKVEKVFAGWLLGLGLLGLGPLGIVMPVVLWAQAFSTTTVQGTVYLANGKAGSGTLQVSWPAFTTANNQAVAAGRTTVAIGGDGFVSVNLAPNQGSSPAGLYYTAIYHLSDGTTSTEYWVIPAAAQATLAQVRAQVMPAAQAVQAVTKTYVDQSVQELTESLLTASGGNLSGPLFLNGDPSQPTQAATKRYVDGVLDQALPRSGGVVSGPLTGLQLGAAYQVDQFKGANFGAKLQACVNGLDATYGGTCDARNFTGTQAMSADVTIRTANATVQLPCATIATAYRMVVTAGTRNVTFHGCALRGASGASGSQGGTVLLYSGTGSAVQVGDASYAVDTPGFHLDNAVINTTASASGGTQAVAIYRTQEASLANLYLLGNANQTGMVLDGTGNYTGGTFQDLEFSGFQTALSGIGHQMVNGAATDWVNASTFLRLHIDCPLSGGSPVSGTYGINLAQGDGNTFTGGDVEGCGTALHLGPNAQNNTIVGLRNENSTNQVVADAGSAYNNWITGGTMFTGQLVDNGTRNSFLDTFHRSFNGLNGDWYGSQQDATVTNHYRIGIGTGNERGYLNRYQTDAGYRWTTGLSDATAGEQFYQVLDELNNVYRLSIGQYNNGQSSSNNQTVINAAGSGAVVLNGSANAGTGGVVIGAGGASGATVATINSAGNAQFNGTLQVGGPATFVNSTTVKNGTDAEVDAFLWAGTSANQKESFIYKDYTGASQWYMVKDASNNWALNSATGGLDSFKAYQSNNSGDTYINASNGTGHIRLNYEAGAGAETDIYSGGNPGLVAAFLGTNSIKFPGLASGSGKNCLQIDNSGYLSNSGANCATGTVSSGSAGQVAVYGANGTTVTGTSAVSVTAGGTGATSPASALANLGAQAALPGVNPDGASGLVVAGAVAATALSLGSDLAAGHQAASANAAVTTIHVKAYGAKCDGVTDDTTAFVNAIAAAYSAGSYGNTGGATVEVPQGVTCLVATPTATLALPYDSGTVNGGSTCGGTTCATLPAENAYTMPVILSLPKGVRLSCGTGSEFGAPSTIAGPWDGTTVPAYTGVLATDQAALSNSKDAILMQVNTYDSVANCRLANAFVALAGPPIYQGLGNARFKNLIFQSVGIAGLFNFLDSTVFDGLWFSSGVSAGITSGGWYGARNPGYDGGYTQKVTFHNVRTQGPANSLSATDVAVDGFFDNYFWKSRNTPGCAWNTAGLSNATCTQPGMNPSSSTYTGRMADTSSLNFYQVYRGIAGSWINLINRNSNYLNNNTVVDGFQSLAGARWDVQMFDGGTLRNYTKENSSGHPANNDPYNPGVLEARIRATAQKSSGCAAMNGSWGSYAPVLYTGGSLLLDTVMDGTGYSWPQAVLGDACLEWSNGAPGNPQYWPANYHPTYLKQFGYVGSATAQDNSFPTIQTSENGFAGNTWNPRGVAEYFLGSPGFGVGVGEGGWVRGGVLNGGHTLWGLQLGSTTSDDGALSAAMTPALQIDNLGVLFGASTAHVVGSAGTGGYAQQTTNATKTSNDCAKFDANGNVVDAGTPCAGAVIGNGGYTQATTNAAKSSGDLVMFDATGNTVDSTIAVSSVTGGCGTGIPCYKSAGTYTGTGAALSLYAYAATAGQYRYCWYEDVTAAGTAGSWFPLLQFTGDGHLFSLGAAALGTIPATTQWGTAQNCYTFYSDASNINMAINVNTTITGAPTLRYAVSLEKLQ